MLICEAQWLGRFFANIPDQELGSVLNLGSSTAEFRTTTQPHIHREIFAPLEQRRVTVVHTDLKNEDGATVSADITRDDDLNLLRALGPTTILCSNMLEHVPDTRAMAQRIALLLPPGGRLVVTVPNSFPYHPDPIDTRFRPSIDELVALFPGFLLETAAVLEGPTFLNDLRRNPRQIPRRVLRSLVPYPRTGGWLSTLDRWRWLFRPYKVTCVILRRPPGSAATQVSP